MIEIVLPLLSMLIGALIGALILVLAVPWISDWADRYYGWADKRIARKKHERYLRRKEAE